MNLKRYFGIMLMFTYLKIFKSEYFKHDTKSLNVIQEQSLNLKCIRVNLSKLDGSVIRLLLNMRIPFINSNELSTSETQAQTSLCPNLIVQPESIEDLKAIFENYDNRAIMFILFRQKVDWDNIYKHSAYYWMKYNIYKVYYITPEYSKFYHPFVKRNYTYGDMVDTTSYNIKDIFKNLNGYPIRVYIFDSVFSDVKSEKGITKVGGVDAKVASLLAKKLNFTMQLQWPYENFFGARLENGSFNGALGRIIRYESDIAMTGFFVKDYLTRDAHFSVAVYMDKLCCYVIKSKQIPDSVLPIYAVTENVWIVYMFVGFCSSFVWMLLRRANLYIGRYATNQETLGTLNLSSTYFQYLNIFADTWTLWLRMIIAHFPPHNSERIFAISLCLVSVIIEALFESGLATVYIHPRYYKDINTLEELEKAHLQIFIKHAAMQDDLFRGQNSRLYNTLDERVMLVGEPEERLISIMSKRGGFAVVTREFTLFVRDIYYLITKKIQIIPECPKTYHIAYLYTKNSPYQENMNVALLQFLAAGLIDQWIDVSKHQAQCHIENFYESLDERSYQLKAFQINDIQLAMDVLIFGGVCSTLLFFAEIIVYKNLLGKINLTR